ncbi:MAG: NTP transferase domain-containing protein [Candidatus Glassbacteria bacterium]
MIAGIFLAAGESLRFERHKLLLEVGDRPLVYYSLKNCLDSLLPEVYVVLGARSEELGGRIRRLFTDTEKIKIIINEDYRRGMMSSLKKGISSLDTVYRGAMVLLADMPMVTPDIINRLMDVFEEKDKIIIPQCLGELHHPRILPERVFPDFLLLDDDEKGTKVLENYSQEIIRVPIGNKKNFIDIDQLDDFESIAELLKNCAG